jgi:uncharacterized membrane protein YfcA
MYLYLPVAHISINIFLLLGLGLGVGFLSGFLGLGGGFLMTPLLMSLGIPPTVAAASDSNQIVASTTSGTYAHWRLGNIDFKMGLFLLAGSFIGGFIGVQIIKVLRAIGNADFGIRLSYVVLLGLVGGFTFIESLLSLRNLRKGKSEEVKAGKKSGTGGVVRFLKSLPFQTYFEKSGVTHSALLPLSVGGFVGIIGAVMGVGGGFIMIPLLIYILRMPVYAAVGTNLFQEIFLCMNVTFFQAYTNHTVDFIIALLLLLGSTSGAQIGARFCGKLKGDQVKIIIAMIILAVDVKVILELTLHPSALLSLAGGH